MDTVIVAAPGWAITLALLALAYAFGSAAGAQAERKRARGAPLHLDAGLLVQALAARETPKGGEGSIPPGGTRRARAGGAARSGANLDPKANPDAPRRKIPEIDLNFPETSQE